MNLDKQGPLLRNLKYYRNRNKTDKPFYVMYNTINYYLSQ